MNTLYEELSNMGHPFELPHVLELLKEKPEIGEINGYVHQRTLVEDVKQILTVADVGHDFGYGHLMRCTELSLQITERLGYPVTFMVDDEYAMALLEERGFRVVWGALSRPATSAPVNYVKENDAELFSAYDLVILDIYSQRNLPSGWRKRFKTDMPVVILDHAEQWAKEADLIVIPGVTGPPDRKETKPLPDPDNENKPKILKEKVFFSGSEVI